MSVIVYGHETAESYGYAAGLSLPNNKQLLSFSSFNFREIGGEQITIAIPCPQLQNTVGRILNGIFVNRNFRLKIVLTKISFN